MKAQYTQRQHSFGLHSQVKLQGEAREAQEVIDWCETNLVANTWDYQVWDIGTLTYLQVDTVDPGAAMLLKLTYG